MCTLKKYREYDPNTIEAVQFTGENGDEILTLLNVRGGVWTTLKREFDGEAKETITKFSKIKPKEISMNKAERSAIEEAIDLLEHEVRYNGRGLWIGSVYVAEDNDITEAIKILKGITKTKGDK